MTTSKELIVDRVVSTAERIEDTDDVDDIDPLDVYVTAGLDGKVRSVHLILTVGGPHIEVDVTHNRVEGWWGGENHETHVRNPSLLNALEDRYVEVFEA